MKKTFKACHTAKRLGSADIWVILSHVDTGIFYGQPYHMCIPRSWGQLQKVSKFSWRSGNTSPLHRIVLVILVVLFLFFFLFYLREETINLNVKPQMTSKEGILSNFLDGIYSSFSSCQSLI